MKTIQGFDPPMCCSTGICGPNVDPDLVNFAGILFQLGSHGIKIERYNLAQQPMAFVQNLAVKALLEKEGAAVLPLITLPEATPVHDAAMLQEDLRRARIEPFAWLINQSLLHRGSCDPLLQYREEAAHRYLREVVEKHATRTVWLPWRPREPIGPNALGRFAFSDLRIALT